MSYSEIMVIIIIFLLLFKPKDIPQIIQQLQRIYFSLYDFKKRLLIYWNMNILTKVTNNKFIHKNFFNQVDRINFYLQKISDLNEEYRGDYSINSVKAYYLKLINKKIKTNIKNNKIF